MSIKKCLISLVLLAPIFGMGAGAIADTTSFDNSLLGVARASKPEQAAKKYLMDGVADAANAELNSFAQGAIGGRWKYLSLSFGVEAEKPMIDAMSVYGLQETKNWFLFNQTSIVNYDGRATLNFGIGLRHISDDETVILGVNAFHDYEFASDHRRAGVGGEILTSVLQLRGNMYKALSGQIDYKGASEVALDGHDMKISYELPYFYSSNLYYKASQWYDGAGYRTSNDEFGVSAEIKPNLTLRLAQNKIAGQKADVSASIAYSYTFGQKAEARSPRDGVLRFKLEPIRSMLYQPVQRENRIMKKTVKLSVTISGY